jgi:hypothetical protein
MFAIATWGQPPRLSREGEAERCRREKLLCAEWNVEERRFSAVQQLGSLPVLADNGSVKATLQAINKMQADGVIGQHAIGGAVGATFYLEPAATVDLDVFIIYPGESTGPLVSLAPIYEHLKTRGGRVQDEYIVIGEWPVQFLLPADDLEREAIAEAVETAVDGVPTRVMTAEHLVAIALRVGRVKDHNRILQFLEQEAVDQERLRGILERHRLASKWREFERRYLEGRQ